MSDRAKRFTALVAVAGLSLASVGWWAATGAGSVGTGGALPDGGVLRLHLDSTDNYIRFDAPNGSGGYVEQLPRQPITSSGTCPATLASAPQRATLSALGSSSPAVGLVQNGLGVCSKGEGAGTPAGRVDADLNQALVLGLGPQLAGRMIDRAELDIESKFQGIVNAELRQGATLVGTVVLDTSTAPDSNPDSGDNDNTRWTITGGALFDNVTLRAVAGAFSLEAGADGTLAGDLGTQLGTRDSLFHLVQASGTLDCGQSTGPVSGGAGTAVADVARDDNSDGSACVPIVYFLRTDAGTVELRKDLLGQTGTVFTNTITWTPEPASYPVERVTTIDTGSGPQPVVWCDGTAAAPELPSGRTWCLTGQSSVPVGGGNIEVTESFYGAGDPVWAR